MLRKVNHLGIKKKKTVGKKQPDPINWKPRKDRLRSTPPVTFLNTEFTLQFKYVSNFSRCIDLLLHKCEVELDLWWVKDESFKASKNDPEKKILFSITHYL